MNSPPGEFHIVSGREKLLSLPRRATRGSQNIWQLSMTLTSSCLEVQRALPPTTDRKWGARRLSTQPNTKAGNATATFGFSTRNMLTHLNTM